MIYVCAIVGFNVAWFLGFIKVAPMLLGMLFTI